jgi:hypothetical protein
MSCGVAVAFYCLCLAPWRAGGTRRYRRALVAVALAYCFVLACSHANTHARLFLQAARGWPLAVLPLSFAFSLTDGKARRARCALVAVASRLGALALPLGGGALVAFALAPWRAGASGRFRPALFHSCCHLAPWRAGSHAPLQAHTVAWSSCGVGARHNASYANPLGRWQRTAVAPFTRPAR